MTPVELNKLIDIGARAICFRDRVTGMDRKEAAAVLVAVMDNGYEIIRSEEIEALRAALEEKTLDVIEARNPGIDREEVRQLGGFRVPASGVYGPKPGPVDPPDTGRAMCS